jgi:hypothetical protein
MLVGTISHTDTGDPVSYDLAHYQIGGTKLLRRTG